MSSIPCPKCNATIEFDLKDILTTKEFTCSQCHTKIALQYKDNKETFQNATEKLNQLKKDLGIN
ncbi:CpXC domain-containing protein [Psychroserpens sp. SPM9]|uniref:CpXC domain-containing protein n=1 Tax=Psychroserpens sp. SPM9 TaxID=2975598 RepID=UPI0021A7096E|nr:CpXC domain-containing protein [Psychroserpens sp. SPM9]MDG5491568.1 CpXC domain-containing protein [Psychroserpens sp. SPM9]